MDEAGKGLSSSSKTETLDGEVDVPRKDPCVEEANTAVNSNSGVCDVSGTDENPNDGGSATEDGSLKAGDGNTGNSVSDEKQVKANVGSVEEVVEVKDNVEKTITSDDVERIDAITEPETERSNVECEGDAGAVGVKSVDEAESSEIRNDAQGASKTDKSGKVEMKDETAMSEIKRKNGASHESAEEKESETSDANEVCDEKAKCEVEDNGDACGAEQNKDDQEKESTKKREEDSNKMGVDNEQEKDEKVSVSYNGQGNSGCETSDADQEKESAKKSEDDDNKMDADGEKENNKEVGLSYNEQGNSGCKTSDADQEKESAKKSEDDDNKMDVDSKQASEENVGLSEQGKPGSEAADAKHSESAKVPEESTQLIEGETDQGITNVNQQEENGEAMEIDYAAEEQVEKDVTVGGALENAAGASIDSNVVKEMEIDERKDNIDVATDLTGAIENPNSPTEDAATGNIQDLKTETGNVSLKEDKKATDVAEEVAREDSKDTLKSVDATVNAETRDKISSSAEGIENESNEAGVAFGAESPAAATDCPKEASDEILGSEKSQDDRDHQCVDDKTVDRQDTMREEDDSTREAPSIDPNQKEDTEMEENPNNSDYADDGTDSDMKTNGVKQKADVLGEDSPREGRKTVSFAKVSFAERPSFKIGASIARAASLMAGSPSVLKGGNFGDETLNVKSFVSQLHCAATDPVKENVVSEIAAGFFLDFRNSSASQQVTLEKVSSKRVRPSDSNAGGTEAFEFEEMGDTYWTDRVIHNGGEEQTPPTEKGNYQVVPVELKPAQVQKTRRPYRRRQSQISIPPHSASDKPANFDENAPAELIMNFSETDTIPSEKSLSKMFRHFGPIKESQTEVDKENNRARVVYRKGSDAEVAYNSAGRFNIFGTKTVNYELSHTITEAFKVKPYVVSLGEEDAALGHPS